MPRLQDWIHRIEEGAGKRYLRISLGALAVLMFLVLYNLRGYRNFATLEAMDAAQVARNLAEGKGYTTYFVRPFSIYLVKKVTHAKYGVFDPAAASDPAALKTRHPDLSNPPVYPVVLAGLMKVLPFRYELRTPATGMADLSESSTVEKARDKDKPSIGKRLWNATGGRVVKIFTLDFEGFWSKDGRFWRYQPDFLIALFNQALFLVVIALAFRLARRLFDKTVAWISALVLFGTELLWRFSVSGLSTMLLLVIFMGLVWCLVLLESCVREGKWGNRGLFGLTAAAGVLVGLGALTRYSFGWLILPVLVFLILFAGQRRVVLCVVAFAAFLTIVTPWVVRNFNVSGTPFGTRSFALVEGTGVFPENRLQRSLQPDFSQVGFGHFWRKLLGNTREIVRNDLPRLGGSWISAFFLVGLLVMFRSPTLNRLRYFLLMCLVVLVAVQALGRTQLWEDSPEINSENLLVLLSPLVIIYGVSLFLILLDQVSLPFRQLRYVIMGGFILIVCAPLFFVFLPPRSFPVAYPPYYPPVIQQVAGWMQEDELMMSDIPWAVAWYGKRQCVWLTLNVKSPKDAKAHEDFYTINDYQKAINGLYLTPQTMDSRFLSQWIRPGDLSWGSFILESMVRQAIPPDFPLKKAPAGFLPEQLFLTDWERWPKQPRP